MSVLSSVLRPAKRSGGVDNEARLATNTDSNGPLGVYRWPNADRLCPHLGYAVKMLETSARLLRLLSLLQSRRFWTGAELARELDVTERTVRRDIDKLRSLEYPVSSTAGVAGGYRLGAGARLPPLLLDDDEALAVSYGLRLAAAGSVAGLEEAALRALGKLGQVLPVRLRERIDALHGAFVAAPFRGPQVDPDRLSVLLAASHEHAQVEFAYSDGAGRKTQRRVHPYGLVNRYAHWYLVAWDLMREDWRTFRADRIEGEPVLGGHFAPRALPHGDLASFVAEHMDTRAYTHQASVELHAPLHIMLDRLPAFGGQLEPLGPDCCIWETGAHDLSALSGFLVSLDVDFVVREPPELVQRIAEFAERLRRAAQAADSAAPQ
jgi:predicted DNA-binding transcriptional regulator YafY